MEKNFTPPILSLGTDFYDEVRPAPFPQCLLRYRNQEAAEFLGVGSLSPYDWMNAFGEFSPRPGNLNAPLALRYHGHQFGVYNPDLGDGRGFLYAQIFARDQWWDLGTKGSGTTPYSRRGDGRLTLKGAFREILCTEYLQSLGVNTSRTLSVFETGESLVRHDEPSPTRAGVLVRLCRGHIRIGTFQRLAFFNEIENIKKLTQYCLRYYYSELGPVAPENSAEVFLKGLSDRLARLAAEYMLAGFVHGVLNTDNINVSGESFDYGPYRFLPHYDVNFTAAYFDNQGFYSYGRQPSSFLWNLEQLAASLKIANPELNSEKILSTFGDEFNRQIRKNFLRRLALRESPHTEDLLAAFFHFLEEAARPFEQVFFDLNGGWNETRLRASRLWPEYEKREDLKSLLQKIPAAGEPSEYFRRAKPETLLIDEIEALWKPIAERDDWEPFETKLRALRSFRGVYGNYFPVSST